MAPSSPRVLVLGTTPSLNWNVTRSLNRIGIRPLVLGWHPWAPYAWTGACRKYLRWEGLNWIEGELGSSALDQVSEVVRRHRIDLVLGADYDAVNLLSRDTGGLPKAPVSDRDTLALLNDKWRLSQYLAGIGLPIPASVRCETPEDLRAADLPFPMITKPLDMWSSVGFEVHRTREELHGRIDENRIQSRYPLIASEYIGGGDLGVSCLTIDGRVAAHTTFENRGDGYRHFLPAGRPLELVARALGSLRFTGVSNWDFRYDPARDDYRILECNPRFWASQLYTNAAGLNFPGLMVQPDVRAGRGETTVSKLGPCRPSPYELLMSALVRRAADVDLKHLDRWHHPRSE